MVMNKKQLVVTFLILVIFFSGCATVNFSANYYALPPNYKTEITKLWDKLIYKIPLKYKYTISIVSDDKCKIKGIPENARGVIQLPDNYIKYVYQNYYDNRFIIFTSLIAHELCHSEYDLLDNPPEVHFQTDEKAISLLFNYTTISAYGYYKSMTVLKNYWFARKGVAGHTFNVGWNVLQIASLVEGGPYCFADWFATDLDTRFNLLSKKYGIPAQSCFDITKSPENIINTKEPEFNFFLAKESITTTPSVSTVLPKPALSVKDGNLELPKKALSINK